MSSKQAEEMGLTRKGDGYEAPPEHFTIMGVDISREALIKRYEGKATEIAIIEAIKQDRRSKALAPPAFVESCEGGIIEPVQFVRLRPDNTGKAWLVIDKGNNRCAALRIVNEKRKLHGHPPFELSALQSARPGSGEAAGSFARERHALSNVRAKMLPSHNADVAAGFRAQGIAPHGCIRYLDGVSTEAEVLELIALAECIEAVKDAVDAGTVPVKSAVKLAKMSETKQEAWLAARTAPKPPREKPNGHPRPLSPKKIDAIAEQLTHVDSKIEGDPVEFVRELFDVIRGRRVIGAIEHPDLRAAMLRAGLGAS